MAQAAPVEDSSESNHCPRARRAREQRMVVIPHWDMEGQATGLYSVITESKSTYLVDWVGNSHDCPDFKYRGVKCKHLWRVEQEMNENGLPRPGETVSDYMEHLEERSEDIYLSLMIDMDDEDSDTPPDMELRLGFMRGIDRSLSEYRNEVPDYYQ